MCLSLCLPLPGSDMCMQTHCLEGDMTKTPRSLWAVPFFLLLPVLRHWGKLNPNRADAPCAVLESIAGSFSQICFRYFPWLTFSTALINGILSASQEVYHRLNLKPVLTEFPGVCFTTDANRNAADADINHGKTIVTSQVVLKLYLHITKAT